MTRSVMWFRRDLRVEANAALAHAAADGAVVPLFVLDPAFARAGAPRRAFLAATLHALRESTDGALVVRAGDPAEVVPAVAGEAGASVVVATGDDGPYGRRRDEAVARSLAREGRQLRLVGSPYAVRPGAVTKADGAPYAVFTPFLRAWSAQPAEPVPAPDGAVRWGHLRPTGRVPAVPADARRVDLPPAGEDAARSRWADFLDAGPDGLDGYDARRDLPGLAGTSAMSPYLRWGAVHPSQLLADLDPSRPAHATFAAELAWREFYADVLLHHPDSGWRNLDRRMDAMPVDVDAAARRRFAAWRDGATGYPIVDAGMRQLLATGWMHNRVRMITASFLVKDLHLPWQWGARHFMRHLVDGDLASNSHGWQWSAGTGTDAAPYFRIFNPVRQGETCDADGTYVRRWVPELAGLDDRDLHAPWRSRHGPPPGYPAPIVDHAAERREALHRYAVVTGR
jgi:deoxyribodipyrimidine photo-lyase